MNNAVVIGASSGIGRELALLLASGYDKVGITGRRKEKLAEIKDAAPEKFEVSVFDAVSDTRNECLGELVDRLGDVELVVLCSGNGFINEALGYGPEEETISLNTAAFTRMAVFVYDYFRKRGTGHLVAVTSVMGLRGSRSAPAYAATKAYQINYLEGLRQKSVREKNGITVTDIRPGSVRTDMMKGDGHFWISSPQKAAACIYKAIKKKKTVQYVTPRWSFIGFVLKALPGALHRKM